MVDVFLAERARERLDALDAEPQERIEKKLRSIRDFSDHYLKPLSGRDDYRLRIGDYRALIDWDMDNDALYVKSVGHRRNSYDREL